MESPWDWWRSLPMEQQSQIMVEEIMAEAGKGAGKGCPSQEPRGKGPAGGDEARAEDGVDEAMAEQVFKANGASPADQQRPSADHGGKGGGKVVDEGDGGGKGGGSGGKTKAMSPFRIRGHRKGCPSESDPMLVGRKVFDLPHHAKLKFWQEDGIRRWTGCQVSTRDHEQAGIEMTVTGPSSKLKAAAGWGSHYVNWNRCFNELNGETAWKYHVDDPAADVPAPPTNTWRSSASTSSQMPPASPDDVWL